jgi:hypothetical protein
MNTRPGMHFLCPGSDIATQGLILANVVINAHANYDVEVYQSSPQGADGQFG